LKKIRAAVQQPANNCGKSLTERLSTLFEKMPTQGHNGRRVD
jgi:hypothetical protein